MGRCGEVFISLPAGFHIPAGGEKEARRRVTSSCRAKLAPTDNLEAYDCFLRGWGSYWQLTQQEMAQARQMLEQAVQLDPQYAGAHALLSSVYLNEFAFQWDPRPQTLERAFELAQQAVALDDSLALAGSIR